MIVACIWCAADQQCDAPCGQMVGIESVRTGDIFLSSKSYCRGPEKYGLIQMRHFPHLQPLFHC